MKTRKNENTKPSFPGQTRYLENFSLRVFVLSCFRDGIFNPIHTGQEKSGHKKNERKKIKIEKVLDLRDYADKLRK